jgi:hypothetical protein
MELKEIGCDMDKVHRAGPVAARISTIMETAWLDPS